MNVTESFSTGFSNDFDFAQVMVFLIFLAVLGVFTYTIVKGLVTWVKNNNSPRLTVDAKVVGKRLDVSHHHHNNGGSTSSTRYFATFQVESGDRIEFVLNGSEYAMLAEQDKGKLRFQGSRYLEFNRV